MSERSKQINTMFSSISSSYDHMNHLLSFGVDRSWRSQPQKKIREMGRSRSPEDSRHRDRHWRPCLPAQGKVYRVKHHRRVDFNSRCWSLRGRSKAAEEDVLFEQGDALNLKYKSNHFDVVTSGFALRSFDDLDRFAGELHRVLKPGGVFVLLDLAKRTTLRRGMSL